MRTHVPVFLWAVASACATPVLVGSPGSPAPSAPAATVPANAESMTEQVVRLANQYRAKNGRRELTVSPKLMQAALLHAQQMATAQELAHNISAARYPTLQARLDAVGYAYGAAGENIAWNQPDADDVMNTWLNSTGHRANILDPNVTEIGVAVAYSARREPYWVQVLGRPR